ncbi:MAG: hypothetical protein IPK82_05350 [Polyangiaceae bacterium]|nr:hypothetical protein [Polyangiaceae bacterium]
MSDAHGHESDHDDAHDDHGFDGEPVKELGPDEPQTPNWLPLVGILVFVAGAVFFVTQREAPVKDAKEPAKAEQIVAKPMEPKPAQPVQARPVPQPAGSDAPIKKLTPDQVKDLQKRLQEVQKQRQEAGGAK